MDFDLRTCKSAYSFILKFLNITRKEYIRSYFIECKKDFELFWKRYYKKINDIDIRNIRIIGFHVTGSLDECEEIRTNGIRNLQKVLSENTIVRKVLRKYGVIIDVKSQQLHYKDIYLDINYENYKGREELSYKDKHVEYLAHRIYYDFCISGFMMNDNVLDYGTNIHKRPEFIMRLVELFPDLNIMEKEWINRSISYRIDFYTYFKQLHRFSFELDEEKDPPYNNWHELTDEQKLKKWMLSHAIDRANGDLDEVYLYVKDEVDILPEQILSCTKL